jgi:hypothetical protein
MHLHQKETKLKVLLETKRVLDYSSSFKTKKLRQLVIENIKHNELKIGLLDKAEALKK